MTLKMKGKRFSKIVGNCLYQHGRHNNYAELTHFDMLHVTRGGTLKTRKTLFFDSLPCLMLIFSSSSILLYEKQRKSYS